MEKTNVIRLGLVSLLVINVFIFVIYVVPLSPKLWQAGEIYRVSIGDDNLLTRYHIPGRELQCGSGINDLSTHCQVKVDGKVLSINVTYANQNKVAMWGGNCTASYGGQPVTCTADLMQSSSTTIVNIDNDLGINPGRRLYLGLLKPFAQFYELHWILLAIGLATLFGVTLASEIWIFGEKLLHQRALGKKKAFSLAKMARLLSSMVVGVMIFWATKSALLTALLVLGYID